MPDPPGIFENVADALDGVGCVDRPPGASPLLPGGAPSPFPPDVCAPPGNQSGAPPETPSQIAARHWEDVPLPRPEPYVAPGRAITGKPGYLETRGRLQHTYTQDTPLGRLEIDARGTYTVDWGDGETSGPFDVEGAPWPDGRITHDYVDIGAYDIVVTERWTATWRMGSESGSLQELRTVGRIEDFPVEQVQAVRER